MRNCHFSFQMTGATQRDEVSRVVGYVSNQVFSPAFDVVDIQASSASASFNPTKSANFISVENCKTKPLPVRPEFEAAPASVIWVRRANGSPLGADVRAKPPASAYFAGKRTKQFPTLRASDLFSSHKTSVPTFPGAVSHGRTFVFEHLSANGARDRFSGVLQAICGLARLATKSELRVLFHHMARALKSLVAIGALERRSINHRRGMAIPAAKDCGRMIGLKLFGTLGAVLEHH